MYTYIFVQVRWYRLNN